MLKFKQFLLLITAFVAVSTNPSPSSPTPGTKNSQWFEDTIDEFLRNAQDNGETTDIQVSTCKISSQQLMATAQATAARVLKGVCNPNEISEKFQELELRLESRLSSLNSLLESIENKLLEQDGESKRNHRRIMSLLAGIKKSDAVVNGGGGGSTVIDNSVYTPAYIPSTAHKGEEIISESEDRAEISSSSSSSSPPLGNRSEGSNSGKSKSSSGSHSQHQQHYRSDEIARYNSTVHIENGKRVFSFYWSVNAIAHKLNNWTQKRVLRSNSFYIFPRGYRMYMKIIPRYSPTTMYIHAGITKGDFDETLEWPFSYKMRVQVLDQNENRGQDLKSRLWDPKELCSGTNWRMPIVADNDECVGLGFPHGLIQTPDYIRNDRIIIKLTVHLD